MKIPTRSSATFRNENYQKKCCFIRSILVSLHPCENIHPKTVSKYTQYFDELNIQSCDFSNGYNCSDFHKIEKLNILSIAIFELSFYQDQKKWKYKLKPVEISKTTSVRVFDLLIYNNPNVFFKK